MRRVLTLTVIFLVTMLACKGGARRLDLLPIDPDFDLHVEALITEFNGVYEDFLALRNNYNHHLFIEDHGTLEEMDGYMASCKRKSLELTFEDTTLSALERLDILDAKADDLVDCAWDFEEIFSLHYNDFHGEWDCMWALFYSPVPDSLARNTPRNTPATYVRRVEQNLEGLSGFIYSLRLDFDDHMEEFH